jgi:serine/threonine protein kinase
LKTKEIWDVILQTTVAVYQIHQSGIVHLDIKPENFFVMADNTIKLGDFGHSFDLSNTKKKKFKSNHPSSSSIRDIDEGD